MRSSSANGRDGIAFVFGSGSSMGAVQAGMVRALSERKIFPDMIVGSSIGAFNGAIFAADPSAAGAARLERVWREMDPYDVVPRRRLSPYLRLLRRGESIYPNDVTRSYLQRTLSVAAFEDLGVPLHCVATDVADGSATWFDRGPLVEPVLASLSTPVMFPSVEIGGRRYIDGGTVDDMPVGRAAELGARALYVLETSRMTRQFEIKRPLSSAQRAVALARRHRYESGLAALPDDVEVHVLPTGEPPQVSFHDASRSAELMQIAYEASLAYLDEVHQRPGAAAHLN